MALIFIMEILMIWWMIDYLVEIFAILFCVVFILATRPNCEWAFKGNSESEEKKRKLFHKIAIIGFSLWLFFRSLGILLEYIGQIVE